MKSFSNLDFRDDTFKLMPEELFKIISFLTVFQVTVFIMYLNKKKTPNSASRFYLNLFLLSILFSLIDRLQFYYREELYQYNFPHLYNLIDIFNLVYLPALFYYLLSITKEGFKIKRIQALDFTPASIVFTNLFFNYYIQPAEVKYELLQDNAPFTFVLWNVDIPTLFNLLQNGYLIIGLIVIFRYERTVKSQYANINHTLIQLLKIAFITFLTLRIGRLLLTIFAREIFLPIDFDLAVFALLIIIFGFKNSTVFLNPIKKVDSATLKIRSAGVKEKLEKYMEESKPFLDPDLSLNMLANQLEISERELSQCLNGELRLNFFNFINQHRVAEAKKQLQDPQFANKTILEILYEAGFNNKSAFNREFKKITGATPSEFRINNT